MSKKKPYLYTWTLAILALLLASCSSVTPTLPPQPTQDPLIIQATMDAAKTQAVSTVIAQQTQNTPVATATTPPTAVPPTQTVQPTATVVLPTATATLPPFPTWTPGPSKTPTSIVCSIESASPSAGSKFPVKSPFDWRWKVKNTSGDTWKATDTDVKYLSGTKMHEGDDTRDLPSDVAANGTYELILDMIAPETPGYYQETWGLTQGGTLLCAVG